MLANTVMIINAHVYVPSLVLQISVSYATYRMPCPLAGRKTAATGRKSHKRRQK